MFIIHVYPIGYTSTCRAGRISAKREVQTVYILDIHIAQKVLGDVSCMWNWTILMFVYLVEAS